MNHHQLEALGGSWTKGRLRGRYSATGWGADMGFPGLILDDTADWIEVDVLETVLLPHHWTRLDVFEGEDYERVEVTVETDDGPVQAFIYVVGKD